MAVRQIVEALVGEEAGQELSQRPGDVLVCAVTSPVWSVLFRPSAHWSPTSAACCPIRRSSPAEYRVPAVVATGDATSRLIDREIITVDGTTGIVRTSR